MLEYEKYDYSRVVPVLFSHRLDLSKVVATVRFSFSSQREPPRPRRRSFRSIASQQINRIECNYRKRLKI